MNEQSKLEFETPHEAFYQLGIMPCCGRVKKYREITVTGVNTAIACSYCGELWLICIDVDFIRPIVSGWDLKKEDEG